MSFVRVFFVDSDFLVVHLVVYIILGQVRLVGLSRHVQTPCLSLFGPRWFPSVTSVVVVPDHHRLLV